MTVLILRKQRHRKTPSFNHLLTIFSILPFYASTNHLITMVCTNLTVFASGENLVSEFQDKANRVELLISRNLHFLCCYFLMAVSDSFLFLRNQTEIKIATETRKSVTCFLECDVLLNPNAEDWCPPSSCSLA